MKKLIISASTRGHSSRVTGEKRRLRDIVDNIYDEVEGRGLVDWFGNIKSAGPRYYIDWFRKSTGWMLEDEAEALRADVADVVSELGYSNEVEVILKPEDSSHIVKTYGGVCYIVRVVVG